MWRCMYRAFHYLGIMNLWMMLCTHLKNMKMSLLLELETIEGEAGP